jgi:FKBP-type peptidyl-prolyl cis-trans isomerase
MRTMKTLVFMAMATLVTLTACGPSKQELQAQKAAEEKARIESAIREAQEASKAPVLTEKDHVVQGERGLEYVDTKVGTGKEAKQGGTVTVNFIGWVDGSKIDSSDDRGKPVSFIVGGNQVIDGWSVGVKGMREGGVRLLIIPPELAYGKEGKSGFVGPDRTLWYRLELVKAYDPF